MEKSFWKYTGSPSAWHLTVALYFAFAFGAARFILDRFIFRWLAIWLLIGSGGTTRLTLDGRTRRKLVKCTESLWKLTYYLTIEFFTVATAYREPWFRGVSVTQYFIGWPHHEIKLPLKLIYMCQCGFHIYSIAALLLWETRRKDFPVMMAHRAVTVILISSSYVSSLFQIGAVILLLHDASDVFLEAAKIFKYSVNEPGARLCFGCFALSWFILGLIVFPFWVIWSSRGFYFSCKTMDLSQAYNKLLYCFFNTMLFTLLFFHLYWWKLICCMVVMQMQSLGRVVEDIRSDSEEDD
ncbi:ceramide synthase LOH2-like [Andrographis paniculata]|uniref:ceramide synthase LOH2-like n=1 Tax=Andrographis paniculata TaxID=175694 RepID=UPI0021E7D789|nr:ceramide synthase LOH2-like [Andrographis paniculata]